MSKSKLGYKKNSPYKNEPFIDIASNLITMKDVEHPVLAIPDNDEPVIMLPNKEYNFKNSTKVREIPLKDRKQHFVEKYISKFQEGGINIPLPIKYDISSEEYKQKYKDRTVANYDPKTEEYILPELEGVTISAPKYYDFEGCVKGVCNDLAESNSMSEDEIRKTNNLYGDAWKLMDNTYGEDIPIDKKFSNLKVNDLISLSRKPFKSDKKKGIPEKEQHVGRISKIVDGIPYVKHYVNSKKQYYEEPITNISQFVKYSPARAKRLDYFKEKDYAEDNLFTFDPGYEPLPQEIEFKTAVSKYKKEIQDKLSLGKDEYKRLADIAYGIMGVESSFGSSKRMLYRAAVPDAIQKLVKIGHDKIRGVNVYDDNINNLSQGYSSTKESSLYNVNNTSKTKIPYSESNKKIKRGDYSDLERKGNYLNTAFNNLNINPDNLENVDNSYKAIMSTLAWHLKRNPNASTEDLLKKYTGAKDVSKYHNKFINYSLNIDNVQGNEKKHTTADKITASLTSTANDINDFVKDTKSSTLGVVRDMLPGPVNVKQLLYDMAGGKSEVTQNTLSNDEMKALQEIVSNNLKNNKFNIEYDDYGTSENKNDDVGKGKVSMSKILNDKYNLKTLLGQANIKDVGGGKYIVEDTYDFNDKGNSFGIMDDISKRGIDPYSLVRSLGRNYGSAPNQGSKVQILVDTNKKYKKGGVSGFVEKWANLL